MAILRSGKLVRTNPNVLASVLNVRAACENLLGYSTSNASIFKNPQFIPIKDLKLLVRDYPVSDMSG